MGVLKQGFVGALFAVGVVGGCSLLKDDSYCTREANYDLVRVDEDGKKTVLGDNWVVNEKGTQCYFVQSQSAPPETLPFKKTSPAGP